MYGAERVEAYGTVDADQELVAQLGIDDLLRVIERVVNGDWPKNEV